MSEKTYTVDDFFADADKVADEDDRARARAVAIKVAQGEVEIEGAYKRELVRIVFDI